MIIVNNDVANVEDVANEDDLSASLEEAAFPLDLAIEEIKSMSVSIPQIITIDWGSPELSFVSCNVKIDFNLCSLRFVFSIAF